MKIEVVSQTKDTLNGYECPTHIIITDDKGEVIEIRVEDDTTYYHQYTPYLDIDHQKLD